MLTELAARLTGMEVVDYQNQRVFEPVGDAPCGEDMLLHFAGDCLTVRARKSFDLPTNTWEGVASGYLQK